MADSMVIGLELQNLQTVLAGLKQVSSAVSAINGTITKGAKAGGVMIQSATINTLMITGGNIIINQRGGVGGGGGGRGSSPRIARTPPTFFEKFKTLLMSSRVDSSGNLMPLVGKVMGLLGPEVLLAAAAIKMMADVAMAAAESLTKFRDSMITSGGNAGEVGRLNAIGGAAGINDMAGLSREVADRLATNGQAAAFGTQAGVHDFGGAYSSLDKAKNLEKMIDHIVNIPHTMAGNAEAARFARVTGLESAMKLRDISKETYENLKKVGMANAAAHSESAIKGAAEFNAEMSMLSTNFDTLVTTLGGSFLPVFTDAIAMFNDILPVITSFVNRFKPLIDLLMMATPEGFLAAIHRAIVAFQKITGGNTDENAARDRHTEAMNAHASALRSGTFGGGERARGAVPSAWGGMNAKNWSGEAAKLGAFNI